MQRLLKRPHNRRTNHALGFTLIELLVVIVILGILGGLVVPRIADRPEQAREVKAQMQMEELSSALKQFKIDNGFYPTTEQGLQALVEKPSTVFGGREARNYPQGGYLDKIPEDPWGNEYIYIYPGEHGDFDIVSPGPDGEAGTDRDIVSWELD